MELLIVGLYNFEPYIAIFYSLTMCRLPSGSNNCYQVGYSSNGNNYYTNTASCPGGTPNSGEWFNVRVQIDLNRNVNIYYKDALMKSYTAHFSTKVSGGVLVTNGFRNIIQFSNFSISQQ